MLLYVDRDLRRLEQGVVDQAVVDGALHAGAVLVREVDRGFDFDAEVLEARYRIFHLVGDDADMRALGG